MPFIQIGSDGGFLSEPVILNTLLLAPAERADLLIDFSGIKPGTAIRLLNDAKAPYPDGQSPALDTVGQIMQFYIPEHAPEPVLPPKLPEHLNCIPHLRPDRPGKILTLYDPIHESIFITL
jgi:FtsP/CotA-like multicopper oxidase with cupredoxin domain